MTTNYTNIVKDELLLKESIRVLSMDANLQQGILAEINTNPHILPYIQNEFQHLNENDFRSNKLRHVIAGAKGGNPTTVPQFGDVLESFGRISANIHNAIVDQILPEVNQNNPNNIKRVISLLIIINDFINCKKVEEFVIHPITTNLSLEEYKNQIVSHFRRI